MKEKKMTSSLILCLAIVIVSYIININEGDILLNVKPNSNLLSVLVNDGSGKYVQNDSNTFPLGMVINEELSHCVNNSSIEYNEVTQNISLTSTGSDECTLYFDEKDLGVFASLVLENNGGASYIRTKNKPDFNTVATTDEGMFYIDDFDGISYYFRGAVDNNWVKFGKENGKDIYWRIVRIDGEGNVKLIYSGTIAPSAEEKIKIENDTTQLLNTTKYNVEHEFPEYAGYVYTLGEFNGNTTESLIKTQVDSWYESTLEAYSENIVTTKYCVDREVYSYNSPGYVKYDGEYVRGVLLAYGSLYRLNKSTVFAPSLLCQSVDTFSYDVGLLSSDEVALAGGVWYRENSEYYLNTNKEIWLITPQGYTSVYSVTSCIFANGMLEDRSPTMTNGIRPTISLSGQSIASGTGEYDDPYIIA